jgi:hypothetical protein
MTIKSQNGIESTNKDRNLKWRLISVITCASFLLVSCGSTEKAISPDEAAITPCKTVKSFVDKFLAGDKIGSASYAAVAQKQFTEISSLNTEFGRFAVVMGQAADDGLVDDYSGYSAMLEYCKTKW